MVSVRTMSGVIALLFLGILVVQCHKKTKLRLQNTFAKLYDEEVERLRRAYERGEWEDLPPTAEMTEVINNLAKQQTLKQQLQEQQASFDPQKYAEALEHVNRNILMLEDLLARLDLRQRINPENVKVSAGDIIEPPPRNRREKIARFFVSQGLISSFRGASRALFVTELTLVIPALLGVQSGAIESRLAARVIRLEQLRVEASEREAREAWQQAASKEEKKWDKKDDEAADQIAHAFEVALANTRFLAIPVPRPMPSVRQMLVRQQILQETVKHRGDRAIALHPALSETPGLDPLDRETIVQLEKGFDKPGSKTEAGRQIRQKVEKLGKEYPAIWAKVRANISKAGHSFQQAASVDDATRFLMSRALGAAAGDSIDASTELGRFVQHFSEAVTPDALNRAYRVKESEYLYALAKGSPLDEAIRIVVGAPQSPSPWTFDEQERFKATMWERTPEESLRNFPPGLRTKPEFHEDLSHATQLAKNAHGTIFNGRDADEMTEALATFDDWFPGQYGGDRRTSRGTLLGEWDLDRAWNERAVVAAMHSSEPPPTWPDGPEPGGGGGGEAGVVATEERGDFIRVQVVRDPLGLHQAAVSMLGKVAVFSGS